MVTLAPTTGALSLPTTVPLTLIDAGTPTWIVALALRPLAVAVTVAVVGVPPKGGGVYAVVVPAAGVMLPGPFTVQAMGFDDPERLAVKLTAGPPMTADAVWGEMLRVGCPPPPPPPEPQARREMSVAPSPTRASKDMADTSYVRERGGTHAPRPGWDVLRKCSQPKRYRSRPMIDVHRAPLRAFLWRTRHHADHPGVQT
jgi:hypothetical protein